MSFYEDLAAAKTNSRNDGEFFLGNTAGTVVLHGILNKQSTLKKTVILFAEILESKAKLAGGPTQTKGTRVKKIYSLSTYEWHLNELKTDLVNIVGADEKSMTPNQMAELFKDVFEANQLKGVLAGFNVTKKAREGKTALDKTYFSHIDEQHGNSEAEIAERAKSIADVE